ncbi:MAG: hypothetical protein PF505_15110, partial [Vallitaleaceae bacterium]|nr:hypothetical protein [Vallitaleaceae bacterium]
MAGIQFSGLASGLDTESIVKQLMEVEQMKYDKVDRQKIEAEMKVEVWEEVNTKLYSFYTDNVFDLKSSGVFRARSTSSSDTTKVAASATSNAMQGVYTVGVSQLAKGAHLYSTDIGENGSNTSDTVSTSDLSFTLSDGTTSETITLATGEGVSELMAAINDSGLNINANYDTSNGRIFLDSTETGGTAQID